MATVKVKKVNLKRLSKNKEKKTIGTGDGGLMTNRINKVVKKSS